MFWKRVKVMWWDHKIWFILGVIMFILVILSIMGLASLESFFQQQILGTLPLEIVKMVGYSILGAWAFVVLVYRVGMPMSGNSGSAVNSSDINVTF